VHLVEVAAYPLFKYPPYDLALTSKMLELLEDPGLDVLHVHYAIPHAMCAYLARQMAPASGVKIVTTLHGTDITVVGSDEAYRPVTRFAILNSDRVIAVSHFLARETHRLFDIARAIDVVPNSVDTARFHPGERAPGRLPTLAHVSNFRTVKRPLDVIRAFAAILREVPSRLLLVGDGPELSACLSLAENLDVLPHIQALAPVPDVERVLRDVDLLLQPSGSEAFGLAALEALACGVPVVGYRVGGLPEVVEDGACGFLVPFGDTEQLAARSIGLLRDPETLARFGAHGRARAETLFNTDRSVAEHERIYFECLDGS
jgi:N-acetyl-alpha-D-glucosaminyl L-malate synthase BshA